MTDDYQIRSTEDENKYNIHGRDIAKDLYALRAIEFGNLPMDEKYSLFKKKSQDIYDRLYKKHNYLLYRPMWEELHDRQVFYYDYHNKKTYEEFPSSRIPVFHMTLHNEASDWWIRCKKKMSNLGPLIHFDTHDDMGIEEPANGDNSCNQINHPVTCCLLYSCSNHAIWAMPPWVYNTDYSTEQFLVKKGRKVSYIRSKEADKDTSILAGDVILLPPKALTPKRLKKYDLVLPHRFDRIRISTPNSWKRLKKLIKPNDHFILDIDLDFFCSNGRKVSKKKYLRYEDDVSSFGRVHGSPGIMYPRNMYDDTISDGYIEKLYAEEKEIIHRVKSFMSGLRYLKKSGITPSVINLSDSCTSLFSGNFKRSIFTNEYTPKYFVPLIQNLLLTGMEKLYSVNF